MEQREELKMDHCISKHKPTYKLTAAFFLLFLTLFFVSPSRAESREVNTTNYTLPNMQLAYYGHHHRHYWRHHHWRRHHWCRYHACYHRHYRHYWRYY